MEQYSEAVKNANFPKHMEIAALSSLAEFDRTGQSLPPDFEITGEINAASRRGGRDRKEKAHYPIREIWLKTFQANDRVRIPEENESPIELVVEGEGNTVIYSFFYRAEQYYFRPAMKTHPLMPQTPGVQRKDLLTTSRLTFGASYLNKIMKLDTVAFSIRAFVNGMPGVLSKAVPGETAYTWNPEILAPRALADLVAFEFLYGTSDLHTGNVMISKETEGNVARTFDYDLAAINGLPTFSKGFYEINSFIPTFYSKQFATSLQNLDRDFLEVQLKEVLSPEEINGILFRREILLWDIQLRGPKILLD